MADEWLIDVKVTDNLFDSFYPVSLALTDFEHFTCHGVIHFSPSSDSEKSEPHRAFISLKSKIGQSAQSASRKRATNYVAPFRSNKEPMLNPLNVGQNTGGNFNSGNHITGFQKIGSDQKIFKCDLCGKESNSKNNLSQHVKMIHRLTTEFKKCEMCSFSTKWPQSLKRHYASAHHISETFGINNY